MNKNTFWESLKRWLENQRNRRKIRKIKKIEKKLSIIQVSLDYWELHYLFADPSSVHDLIVKKVILEHQLNDLKKG